MVEINKAPSFGREDSWQESAFLAQTVEGAWRQEPPPAGSHEFLLLRFIPGTAQLVYL